MQSQRSAKRMGCSLSLRPRMNLFIIGLTRQVIHLRWNTCRTINIAHAAAKYKASRDFKNDMFYHTTYSWTELIMKFCYKLPSTFGFSTVVSGMQISECFAWCTLYVFLTLLWYCLLFHVFNMCISFISVVSFLIVLPHMPWCVCFYRRCKRPWSFCRG